MIRANNYDSAPQLKKMMQEELYYYYQYYYDNANDYDVPWQ
jgi:hypothetical protein